jgi:hypothetical protein
MECPICGCLMDHWDQYGLFCAHQTGEKHGDIYICPNGKEQNGTCESENFSVAGSFYTDRNDTLHEGYPC